jgi:hypothetical protein
MLAEQYELPVGYELGALSAVEMPEVVLFAKTCGVRGEFDDISEYVRIWRLGNMYVNVAAFPPAEVDERVPS